MSRYIDADVLREPLSTIIENAELNGLYNLAHIYERCLEMVENAPTADVVPKSEVEALLKENARWLMEYANYRAEVNSIIEKAKREIAREIFKEIETVLCRSVYPKVNANGTITPITSKDWHIRCDDYNAIKKKYTEEKK